MKLLAILCSCLSLTASAATTSFQSAMFGIPIGTNAAPPANTYTNPASYNPVAWWSADVTVTNTLDGSSPPLNGQDIGVIGDRSGHGNNLLHSGVIAGTYTNNFQNSLPVIIPGNGTLCITNFGYGNLAQPLTVFWVGYFAGGNNVFQVAFDSAANANICALYCNGTEHFIVGQGTAAVPTMPTGWYVFTAVIDGPNSALYTNGVLHATYPDAGTNPLIGMRLFNIDTLALGWIGPWSETIVYTNLTESTCRSNVTHTLGGHWGITVP